MVRTFIQTREFSRNWDKLGFKDEDLRKLELELLENSDLHPVIKGTGGLRKIRIPFANEGKSGSARVCYVDFVVQECNLLEYLTQRDIQTKNSGVNVRYRGKHRFFKGFNEFIKEKTRRCDNDFEKIERHVFF